MGNEADCFSQGLDRVLLLILRQEQGHLHGRVGERTSFEKHVPRARRCCLFQSARLRNSMAKALDWWLAHLQGFAELASEDLSRGWDELHDATRPDFLLLPEPARRPQRKMDAHRT